MEYLLVLSQKLLFSLVRNNWGLSISDMDGYICVTTGGDADSIRCSSSPYKSTQQAPYCCKTFIG
jgi:hypothetical protein